MLEERPGGTGHEEGVRDEEGERSWQGSLKKALPPCAPHLRVAQYWVCALHSRHSQGQLFQPPQEVT